MDRRWSCNECFADELIGFIGEEAMLPYTQVDRVVQLEAVINSCIPFTADLFGYQLSYGLFPTRLLSILIETKFRSDTIDPIDNTNKFVHQFVGRSGSYI